MRILVIFAHPLFEGSVVNRQMLEKMPTSGLLTFHDLYEVYPDFEIDILQEKTLVDKQDLIIWQYPMYWYSAPALLKQWIDLVLDYEWVYGKGENILKGKKLLQVVTVGADRENYCSRGREKYSVSEFLRPYSQVAQMCGMEYLPPYVIYGARVQGKSRLEQQATYYAKFIRHILENKIDRDEVVGYDYTSDWFIEKNINE